MRILFGAAAMSLACAAAVEYVQAADQPQPVEAVEESALLSLLDQAPSLYHQMLRYPNFYGDPNMDRVTIDGSLFHRQYLLGSLGGVRDTLAAHGLVVGAGLTQTVRGAVAGSGDDAMYLGSGDIWVGLDTGRAGLWPGGLFYGHFEGDWGNPVGGTGAILPLNGDAIMPAPPSSAALSELYLVQGLPAGFALVAGKVDFAAFADTNFFANNERFQFQYEGMINNPILGSFVPYTSLGAMLLKQVTPELGVGVLAASNNTNALSPGFDQLSTNTMTYGVALNWAPTWGNLPGSYNVLVGYTSKDTIAFDIDERYLLGEIIGVVPVEQKPENYAITLGGSQFLWTDSAARRSDGQPVGIGPFFRLGFAPDDRNVIDQFYSVGIAGNGGLFGRVDDNWGIGWSGTHISFEFRRDAAALGVGVDEFEHAIEAFYNVALTPAAKTSFHAQYINSANPTLDDALVLSTRLQLDF